MTHAAASRQQRGRRVRLYAHTNRAQAVKAGTPLLNVDLDAIRAAGLSTESAVIVTNADDLPKLHIIAGGIVSTGTPLFKFE